MFVISPKYRHALENENHHHISLPELIKEKVAFWGYQGGKKNQTIKL
jgi:hypothetical protein